MKQREDPGLVSEAMVDLRYPDSLHEIYETVPCGLVSMLFAGGQIVQANRRFLEWVGLTALCGGERLDDFLAPAARIFMQTHFAPLMLVEQGVQEVAMDLVDGQGTRRRVFMSASLRPASDHGPAICRLAFFHVQDRIRFEEDLLQARRAAEQASRDLRRLNAELAQANATLHARGEELHHMATHDHLTALANRQEFERRLTLALQSMHAEGGEHALLYMDLDRFKQVNDSCGHAAGDALLRGLTAKMKAMLRRGDVFARLGGDEFGVLLHECSVPHGSRIALQLLQVVRDYVLEWNGRRLQVGLSVGVAGCKGCIDIEEWARRADAACYAAKAGGRDRVEVFS